MEKNKNMIKSIFNDYKYKLVLTLPDNFYRNKKFTDYIDYYIKKQRLLIIIKTRTNNIFAIFINQVFNYSMFFDLINDMHKINYESIIYSTDNGVDFCGLIFLTNDNKLGKNKILLSEIKLEKDFTYDKIEIFELHDNGL